MPNTKVTKRKDVERESLSHPDSSDDDLPPNVGNGNLIEGELVHVHEKCDHLMAQLKALNQAAGETELAAEISPFVTPELITPVVTPIHKIAQAANAVSQNLECYLTKNVVDTNTDLGQLCGETTKKPPPIEVNIVIDKAGIRQPLKSIGEMLNELPKASSVSSKISESNIMVDTPVYN